MSYVTGISGNAISAASAGWAPTNSAEVSAIASAYATGSEQVVSAVGTETAYTPDGVSDVVTSINGNYISALSADSAFQASYDENGRELTSLASEYEISSIASAYAESAVSAVSGDYYSTSNPSGFITSAPFDSATCSAIASAYAESAVSSVSSNYYTTANESGYALSSDVSGTVDLVSTQSANWGGSALALSAGPGVKLEKVGDTLVASTDETVLFSGSNGGMVATNLTEPLSGFNSFKICFNPFGGGMSREWKEFSWAGSSDVYTVATFHKNGNDNLAWYAAFQPNTDGTTLTPIANKLWILGSTTVQDRTQMTVYRVVGINRTAEA